MKIIWHPAVTLDGFIARTDGDSDWVTEEDEKMFDEQCREAGCVIVGRTTYEQYKNVLYPIERAKTYVITNRSDDYKDTELVKFVAPDVDLILSLLESNGHTSALLSGGGETNGLFASKGKITDIIMSIYPMILGDGIKMLGSFEGKMNLRLISTTDIGDGVVQNRYVVVN